MHPWPNSPAWGIPTESLSARSRSSKRSSRTARRSPHGGAAYGAGWIAARHYGAAEIVDPAPAAVGSIARVLAEYPDIERVLPAMGYSESQVQDLETLFRNADAEFVVSGAPVLDQHAASLGL